MLALIGGAHHCHPIIFHYDQTNVTAGGIDRHSDCRGITGR